MDINQVRKLAGLPLTESHHSDEKKLFDVACASMKEVAAMCESRLKDDLSDEHKKQYADLLECAKKCCSLLKEHTASY